MPRGPRGAYARRSERSWIDRHSLKYCAGVVQAGRPDLAFGALTNAISTCIKHNPDFTYRDLVVNVRRAWFCLAIGARA